MFYVVDTMSKFVCVFLFRFLFSRSKKKDVYSLRRLYENIPIYHVICTLAYHTNTTDVERWKLRKDEKISP